MDEDKDALLRECREAIAAGDELLGPGLEPDITSLLARIDAALASPGDGWIAVSDGWSYIESALTMERTRMMKSGSMFPQLRGEHERSDAAFHEVLACIKWAKENKMPLPNPPAHQNAAPQSEH